MEDTPPPEPKPTMTEKRAMRMQKRIDRFEARRAGPPPPRRIHRTIIVIAMMLSMLALLYLLTFGPSQG